MGKNHSMTVLLAATVFLYIMQVNCIKPLVPALYVFGDSFSDNGNNNFLQTTAKVNYTPYGIDFPSGISTGRFTNGRTIIDFIADYLGLPLVPPYLSLSDAEMMNIKTGVNYASGGAGILPETGNLTGDILSLDEQIQYFHSTVRKDLKQIFTRRATLSKHLSESIFSITIGSNDYILNYLLPAISQSSKIYTPQKFAQLLIDRLRQHLTKLYKLGARKFVVFNVVRLGCLPSLVNSASPRPITPCAEDVNNLVLFYNRRLPSMITALENTLHGSTFVQGDLYNMKKTSLEAGFSVQQIPCCETNTLGFCVRGSSPCPSRTTSMFWDEFHPLEKVNSVQAIDCYSGISSCAPINVQQLALKK